MQPDGRCADVAPARKGFVPMVLAVPRSLRKGSMHTRAPAQAFPLLRAST